MPLTSPTKGRRLTAGLEGPNSGWSGGVVRVFYFNACLPKPRTILKFDQQQTIFSFSKFDQQQTIFSFSKFDQQQTTTTTTTTTTTNNNKSPRRFQNSPRVANYFRAPETRREFLFAANCELFSGARNQIAAPETVPSATGRSAAPARVSFVANCRKF
jgi:hypothetical protein